MPSAKAKTNPATKISKRNRAAAGSCTTSTSGPTPWAKELDGGRIRPHPAQATTAQRPAASPLEPCFHELSLGSGKRLPDRASFWNARLGSRHIGGVLQVPSPSNALSSASSSEQALTAPSASPVGALRFTGSTPRTSSALPHRGARQLSTRGPTQPPEGLCTRRLTQLYADIERPSRPSSGCGCDSGLGRSRPAPPRAGQPDRPCDQASPTGSLATWASPRHNQFEVRAAFLRFAKRSGAALAICNALIIQDLMIF